MIPVAVRLADPVKVAAINATLMAIWVAIAAIRLSRIIDALRESRRHVQSAISELREIDKINLGLGITSPEYIFTQQDDFRKRADELSAILGGEGKGTLPELGGKLIQLLSALSNQYPFPTRVKLRDGQTSWEGGPVELFSTFDRPQIDKWIRDITWLEGRLVTPIAIFPQTVRSLIEEVERSWQSVLGIFRESMGKEKPQTRAVDITELFNKVSLLDIPQRFANALQQGKSKADKIHLLLIESDNSREAIPKPRTLILTTMLLVLVFSAGVVYPLMACTGLAQGLKCLCNSNLKFECSALFIPWSFYFVSVIFFLLPAFRQRVDR
jgi:hypothetical protein